MFCDPSILQILYLLVLWVNSLLNTTHGLFPVIVFFPHRLGFFLFLLCVVSPLYGTFWVCFLLCPFSFLFSSLGHIFPVFASFSGVSNSFLLPSFWFFPFLTFPFETFFYPSSHFCSMRTLGYTLVELFVLFQRVSYFSHFL